MIISRKARNNYWETLEGIWSRLSGPCYYKTYRFNWDFHRLYGRSFDITWYINNKGLWNFKEV